MSYSNPARFYARMGPRIVAGLTAESGNVPEDPIAQGVLDAASLEIDLKIGTRYLAPLPQPPGPPAPAPAAQLSRMASLEEQIALWFLYVRRGIGIQETAAAAAKIGYDNAMATLLAISLAKLDLAGCALRIPDESGRHHMLFGSECPHYNPDPEDCDRSLIPGFLDIDGGDR